MTPPQASQSRSLIWPILKVMVVVGALAYLIQSGNLKLGQLMVPPDRIPLMLLGALLVLCITLISFTRHWLLLKAVGVRIGYLDLVQIGFIGCFFNTFLIGGLGGDVVKMAYIIRETGKRAETITSVMVDRVIGVVGLFTLSGIALLVSWDEVVQTPSLHQLCLAVFGLLGATGVCMAISLVSMAKGRRWGTVLWILFVAGSGAACWMALRGDPLALGGDAAPEAILRGRALAIVVAVSALSLGCVCIVPSCLPGRRLEGFVRNRVPAGSKLMNLINSVLLYRNSFWMVTFCYLIGVALQAVALIAIYLFGQVVPISPSPDLVHIFFAAPPAVVANALPISLGGLGVGEAAFDEILRLCRSAEGTPIVGGAAIFLLFRCWTILVGLIGFPLYLKGRKEIDAAQAEFEAGENATGDRDTPAAT